MAGDFTDVMVDIETTDTDPARGHILQIAAVQFNRFTREVSYDFFDRCLFPTPNRRWDEGTREWWAKRPEVLHTIMGRMEPADAVLNEFLRWIGGNHMMMWGKPTHFDHSFLASFFRDHGLQIPFHYRTGATDLNSFARGVYFPQNPPNWEKLIPFVGEEHNAIHDCLHQMKVLYKLLDREPAP